MTNLPFNLQKAIQALGVLLRETDDHCMDHLRLLKLLYIADRTLVKETAHPMIGDRLVAMEKGPLHSHVYDLLKSTGENPPDWDKYFERHGYTVKCVSDPGVTFLSRRELRILNQTVSDYLEVDTWDVVEATHAFEEWKKAYDRIPPNSSGPIELKEMFEAVGLSDADFEAFEEQAKEIALFEKAS